MATASRCPIESLAGKRCVLPHLHDGKHRADGGEEWTGQTNQFTFAPNVTTATEKELTATLKLALARIRKLEDTVLGLCVTLEEEHGIEVGLLPADDELAAKEGKG
jgi:hypothetical protein